jgi:hypothetical protein
MRTTFNSLVVSLGMGCGEPQKLVKKPHQNKRPRLQQVEKKSRLTAEESRTSLMVEKETEMAK